MPTQFLNVDLEVTGTLDLDPLIAHCAGTAFVLRDEGNNGRRLLWFELEISESTADAALRRFVALLSTLPPPLRALWDACDDRCFNIGIQSGLTPHESSHRIEAPTLAALAALAARLELTVYGVGPSTERED